VTSRVNYVVHRHLTLAERLGLNLRYLRYGDLSDKLRRLAGCKIAREGRGSHEMWETPHGHRFPVPRHPGEFHRGLLASIIKQAGLPMSVSEFIQA
jgi:predicted RNA binding protein YcfA (HicA-like mRNA interferase family)